MRAASDSMVCRPETAEKSCSSEMPGALAGAGAGAPNAPCPDAGGKVEAPPRTCPPNGASPGFTAPSTAATTPGSSPPPGSGCAPVAGGGAPPGGSACDRTAPGAKMSPGTAVPRSSASRRARAAGVSRPTPEPVNTLSLPKGAGVEGEPPKAPGVGAGPAQAASRPRDQGGRERGVM